MANVGEEANKIIKKWVDRSRSLNIVFIGRTGTGKSSLINTLFSENVAKEGKTIYVETRNVISEKIWTVNGIHVTLYDTPGLRDPLFDDRTILQVIKDKCSIQDTDLFIYCSRFDKPRLDRDDVDCIKDIACVFGDGFWERALLALTFANVPVYDTTESLLEDFESREREWIELFHHVIEMNMRSKEINSSNTDSIPVVATGYRDKPLPDRRDWFADFFGACLSQVKLFTIPALIRAVGDRVKDNAIIAEIVGRRLSENGDRVVQIIEGEMHTDSSAERKSLPQLVATAQWSDLLIKAMQ